MTKTINALLSLILLSLIAQSAHACFAPPPYLYAPSDELIDRTNNIVLARAVSAKAFKESFAVEYTFEPFKVLKGKQTEKFTIIGLTAEHGSLTHFNHHYDKDFWKHNGGRHFNEPDCQVHPNFAVGGFYLMFLDKPYHSRGFETIVRFGEDDKQKDKWLKYVEKRIQK